MDTTFLDYNPKSAFKKGLNLQNFRTFQFIAEFFIFNKFGQDTHIFKQFLIATQLVRFYLKTTEYYRSYRNTQKPTNILLEKFELPPKKQAEETQSLKKLKIERVKDMLEQIKSGKWAKKDYQPEMFEEFPNGKKIQLVTSVPVPPEFTKKRLTFWQMFGEMLLMLRPLVAIIAIRLYGGDSYKPYILSLVIELAAVWLQRKATVLTQIEAAEWQARQKDIVWRALFKRPVFNVFTLRICKKILGAFMAEHRWIHHKLFNNPYYLIAYSEYQLIQTLINKFRYNQNEIFLSGFERNLF